MTDDTLSPAQAARLLGLSRERVVELNNEGKLPATRTPLGRLFERTTVERYAREREASARTMVSSA